MLEKLIELLGGDNVKKIEDGITEIILERIREDLESCNTYILEPDDITEFAERCKEKAFANIEAELMAKMEGDMRKSLSLQNNE